MIQEAVGEVEAKHNPKLQLTMRGQSEGLWVKNSRQVFFLTYLPLSPLHSVGGIFALKRTNSSDLPWHHFLDRESLVLRIVGCFCLLRYRFCLSQVDQCVDVKECSKFWIYLLENKCGNISYSMKLIYHVLQFLSSLI